MWRYVCGVIPYVGKNEVLAIINSIDQLNFPTGKEDFLDNKIKKLTAFREFGEETDDCTIEIYHYEKIIRLYFLRGCEKQSFKLDHTYNGEVKV